MFRFSWKVLGQQAICGAALLTVANLAQAQILPTIPQPSQILAIPAVSPKTAASTPISQIGGQDAPAAIQSSLITRKAPNPICAGS